MFQLRGVFAEPDWSTIQARVKARLEARALAARVSEGACLSRTKMWT